MQLTNLKINTQFSVLPPLDFEMLVEWRLYKVCFTSVKASVFANGAFCCLTISIENARTLLEKIFEQKAT